MLAKGDAAPLRKLCIYVKTSSSPWHLQKAAQFQKLLSLEPLQTSGEPDYKQAAKTLRRASGTLESAAGLRLQRAQLKLERGGPGKVRGDVIFWSVFSQGRGSMDSGQSWFVSFL